MSIDNLNLITGHRVEQGVAIEGGKTKKEMIQAAAYCVFDKEDFKKLDCLIGTPVKVITQYGEVIVYSLISDEAPNPGNIFIPAGAWANQIINPDSRGSSGTPMYKGTKAKVEVVKDGKVLEPLSLFKKYKKEQIV